MKKLVGVLIKLIIVIIVIISIINICYNKYEANILEQEVSDLITLDLNKDDFNTSMKTAFDYKKVEAAIKSYLNDYKEQAKKINDLKNDQKLNSVLAAANYSADGPAFNETTEFLSKYKEEVNTETSKINKFLEKDTINHYIEDEKLDDYYIKLYKDYINSGDLKGEIKANNENLLKTRDDIINIIDKESKVIEFLKTNTNWLIKNDQIVFSKEDDLNTYNDLIKDIS